MTENDPLEGAFRSIVARQLHQYPDLQVEDLYKLAFQAAMGTEHASVDRDKAHAYLAAESKALLPPAPSPLAEPISPDHCLVRVHIHPFISAGGDLHDLARAFAETSRAFEPSALRLAKYWSWIEAMAAMDAMPFAPDAIAKYGQLRRSQGYPAVHHSPQFRQRYRPAYRVVLEELICLPTG